MKISPSVFNRAFERFQEIHVRECGHRLTTFRDEHSLACEREAYKDAVYLTAQRCLDAESWSEGIIGSGAILEHVRKALAFPDNKLQEWTGKRTTLGRGSQKLLGVQADAARCRRLERLFYELFKGGRADQEVFDGIVGLCGRAYELVAYLFFIADCTRFLPVRVRAFEQVFRELGVRSHAQRRCSWEHYQEYLETVREVQRRLVAKMGTHVTLLNAHSFCWILANSDRVAAYAAGAAVPEMRVFAGTLLAAEKPKRYELKVEAVPRDMQKESDYRRTSGEVAEKKAMEAERARLLAEGLPEEGVDAHLKWVGDCPDLGYDIASVDEDGSVRHIEVKNITNCNRFFVSDNEWRASRSLSNYWLYLVDLSEKSRPVIEMVPASALAESHLCPNQYRVRFSR